MPGFQVHTPETIDDAVRLVAELPDAMFVAGGTDLLPNLKHRLHTPAHLVSLQRVAGLDGIEAGDGLRIGAGVTLHEVATSPRVRGSVPGLSDAAAQVAGPQHRRMGTLGGNVMLDTRCLFYNQSAPWRAALGGCLKKDGDWCHVVGSKATCVAPQSADTVPVLLAVDATLDFTGPDGPFSLPIRDLYRQDGRAVLAVAGGVLLTAIRIPPQPPGHRSLYRKVRARAAVDFPQLGLGVAAAFDGDVCTGLEVVVGAVLPRPKRLRGMDAAVGTRLPEDVIDALAEQAHKQVRPQPSIHGDPAWRRHMARVELRRALVALREGAGAAP